MNERRAVAFKTVRPGDRIEFIGGYYDTGYVEKRHGSHNGKLMIEFKADGDDRARIRKYAEHRSVILYGKA